MRDSADLKKEVAQLKRSSTARKSKHIGVCQTMSNAHCGDRHCVEDLSLTTNFYCDCGAKAAESYCKALYMNGQRTSGLYLVNFNVGYSHLTHVFCDRATDGGGWTVVQRKRDGSENFLRNWADYQIGFGHLQNKHWLENWQ